MNNAWDGIADQVGHGLIQESKKLSYSGGSKTVLLCVNSAKINCLAFREFDYSF